LKIIKNLILSIYTLTNEIKDLREYKGNNIKIIKLNRLLLFIFILQNKFQKYADAADLLGTKPAN
jgi:hypothetical protein